MNLVAKEMLICNPRSSLVLSSGAGTEQQLSAAGFYNNERKCYHRVGEISDIDGYAEAFHSVG